MRYFFFFFFFYTEYIRAFIFYREKKIHGDAFFFCLNRDKEHTKDFSNCFFIRTMRIINREARLMSFEVKRRGRKGRKRKKK